MKRYHQVLVTTSLRSGRRSGERGEEVSGSLLVGVVDVRERAFQLLREVEVPPSPHRPGRNSVRGVSRWGDGFAVCNTSQLFTYDRDLNHITGQYSEKRFGDIHSIAGRDGVLFVTATASDSIIGLDENLVRVFEWWAGSEPELAVHMNEHPGQAALPDRDFRYKGGGHWNRFHINHLLFNGEGDLIVNLPSLDARPGISKFWNVTRRRFHLLGSSDLNPIQGKIHDGIILGEYHYLGRTQRGEFMKFRIKTGQLEARVDCSVPLGDTTGNPVAIEHGWLRGAVHLYDEVFLVGQSRLTLFLVDMKRAVRSDPLRMIGFSRELDRPGLAIYCIEKMD